MALPFLKGFSHIALNLHSAEWVDVLSGKCVKDKFTAQHFLHIRCNWADIEAQVSGIVLGYYCLKLIDFEAGEYLPVADIEAPSINFF